jgi:hypothetical protein
LNRGEGGVSSPHLGAILHVQGQIMIYIVQYMTGNGATWGGKGGKGEKWQSEERGAMYWACTCPTVTWWYIDGWKNVSRGGEWSWGS